MFATTIPAYTIPSQHPIHTTQTSAPLDSPHTTRAKKKNVFVHTGIEPVAKRVCDSEITFCLMATLYVTTVQIVSVYFYTFLEGKINSPTPINDRG